MSATQLIHPERGLKLSGIEPLRALTPKVDPEDAHASTRPSRASNRMREARRSGVPMKVLTTTRDKPPPSGWKITLSAICRGPEASVHQMIRPPCARIKSQQLSVECCENKERRPVFLRKHSRSVPMSTALLSARSSGAFVSPRSLPFASSLARWTSSPRRWCREWKSCCGETVTRFGSVAYEPRGICPAPAARRCLPGPAPPVSSQPTRSPGCPQPSGATLRRAGTLQTRSP